MYRRTKVKKTRKAHHCFGCQFVFPAGVTLYDCCGVWEGDFWSSYICPICDAYLSTPNGSEYNDNGYMQGDLYEGWRDDIDFLKGWLASNKPLPVLFSTSWRKTKEGYVSTYKEPTP